MDTYRITQITIKNFKSIADEVIITDIRECNSMIGLYENLKKDLAHAIIYCMGATAQQLHVEKIADVRGIEHLRCYVILYLNSVNREQKIFQRLIDDIGQETFLFNTNVMRSAEYKENLRAANIDLDKQFNFYDARYRSFVWNIDTTFRNEIIAKVSGMADDIIVYNKWNNQSKLLRINIQLKEKEVDYFSKTLLKIEERIPENKHGWFSEFVSLSTSLLNLNVTERNRKIIELQRSRDELREITARNYELQQQIQNLEGNKNEGNRENLNLLQQLQGDAFQPYNNRTIQSLKSREFLLKEQFEVNTMRIRDSELRLRDLETNKRSIESHLQFMNTPLDQPQDSRLISEDALLKFYQIAHAADELNLDKLSLELSQKEGDLNVIDNRKKDMEYFETMFPERRLTAAAATKLQNARVVFNELKSALKRNIDPNTMLYSKSSPELLSEIIPKNMGFLLTNAFQPMNELYKCMIDSILFNSKYTIVLYKDDKQTIYDMLNEKYPGMFLNVHFVVLSKLPEPVPNFVIPRRHWINYCQPNEQLTRKLYQFMANQKNILCVSSHDDVRNEFRGHTRKYVISDDGQLTYTRMMNVDVLEYWKPGKKPKNMEVADSNVKKMLDANEKCAEIFASLFEEEHVPRNENIDNGNGLRQEVENLKRVFEQAKDRQKTQIERLRCKLDAPYFVPERPDFTERRTIEQRKLDVVNKKILEIQEEIATSQAANCNLTTQITNIENCIKIKMTIKTNELACAVHSKTAREKRRIAEENEERLRKVNEEITKLQNVLEKLKLGIMGNAVYLNNADFPRNKPIIKQKLQFCYAEEEGIDPQTIQLNIPENWRDVIYQERNEAEVSKNALETNITTMKENLHEVNANVLARKLVLEDICKEFNREISSGLAVVLRDMYPEFNYQIKFNFQYNEENERMIVVHENGYEIQIQNLTTTDQELIHWMLFAVLHKYSNLPILFVDFRDNLDIITKIDPIINWITDKSQVFCLSSHGQLYTVSNFTTMQIAVNKFVDIPLCILWRRENIAEEMEE